MANFATINSPAAAAVASLPASAPAPAAAASASAAPAPFEAAEESSQAVLQALFEAAAAERGIDLDREDATVACTDMKPLLELFAERAASAGVAPSRAQDPAEDEAEEDPAPAGDEARIPSDDDAPGGLAAFAPAPALHRRKSSIGLGGLEASISDVLSKGRPAIVAEVERFVAEVDGNGDRRLRAEELVEALYKFFETSTISLASLNVRAILKDQDPALVEDVRRCVQGMDADGDGRLTGRELVLQLFEVLAGYKAVAEDRARIAADADVVRTDLSEAVKKLSWWKRVGAGSAVFGSAAFALLFGSNLMANEVSKDTVVEDKSNFLLSKHGGAVKIQTASAELKPMVPRGEQPPQECRRLVTTQSTSPCDSIPLPEKARRHLAASNPFDEVGFRALQDVGFFDDSAVAAIEGAMGGSIHVKTEDGAESILVKSISHDGDNLVLNGGEAVLVPTHECGSDDEARRLGEGAASGERRLDLKQAYTFCLEGEMLTGYSANECLLGQELGAGGITTTGDLQSLLTLKDYTQGQCQRGQTYTTDQCQRGQVMANNGWTSELLDVFPTPDACVSRTSDFSRMFYGATSFNADIGNWDVRNGESFDGMFNAATSFNADIGNWNVGNGEIFDGMFREATSFNADIRNWDVGNGESFVNMFYGATSFNADIRNWDVRNGRDFSSMFQGATNFNADIGNWDVGNGESFRSMFNGAAMFNQDLSGWSIDRPYNYGYTLDMFYLSGMDNINKCPCFSGNIRACPGKSFLNEDLGTLQDAIYQLAFRDITSSGCS